MFFLITLRQTDLDGKLLAVEIRTSENVSELDIGKLGASASALGAHHKIVLSRESVARRVENVDILPRRDAMQAILGYS